MQLLNISLFVEGKSKLNAAIGVFCVESSKQVRRGIDGRSAGRNLGNS